jgi:hypothetical protein
MLRNKFAHEFNFDIDNGEFELWSSNIQEKLKGKKFTKYTFRTKIVHSFSILAKSILELTDMKKQKTTANKKDSERSARPSDEFPIAIGIELHP